MSALADAVQRWCFEVFLNRHEFPLIVVAGDSSTAKTHCLKRAAHFLKSAAITAWEKGRWPRPPQVMSFVWSHLTKTRDELMVRSALEADILLLDDVGAEVDQFKSGAPTELLRDVLGEREGRFTFITTNIFPADWTQRWDARVNDRLIRKSRVVCLDRVESYQVRKPYND